MTLSHQSLSLKGSAASFSRYVICLLMLLGALLWLMQTFNIVIIVLITIVISIIICAKTVKAIVSPLYDDHDRLPSSADQLAGNRGLHEDQIIFLDSHWSITLSIKYYAICFWQVVSTSFR